MRAEAGTKRIGIPSQQYRTFRDAAKGIRGTFHEEQRDFYMISTTSDLVNLSQSPTTVQALGLGPRVQG